MAKKPSKSGSTEGNSVDKKPLEKKSFDNKAFKKKLGLGAQIVKEKELSWIPFKKAFHDAVGLPGVPRGYTTQFRGFSDVGKSTGIYEADDVDFPPMWNIILTPYLNPSPPLCIIVGCPTA